MEKIYCNNYKTVFNVFALAFGMNSTNTCKYWSIYAQGLCGCFPHINNNNNNK